MTHAIPFQSARLLNQILRKISKDEAIDRHSKTAGVISDQMKGRLYRHLATIRYNRCRVLMFFYFRQKRQKTIRAWQTASFFIHRFWVKVRHGFGDEVS